MFHKNYVLRPSCFECRFKSINRVGDITIGDYWGVEKVLPKKFDDTGVSLIIVNSKQGNEIFERIKSNIEFYQTSIDDAIQPCLVKPFSKPFDRDQFWSDYWNRSFGYIARKYTEYSYKTQIKIRLHLFKEFIKKCIVSEDS